jgi:uncharacterized protein YlaI
VKENKNINCFSCEKKQLSKDEISLNKKLLGRSIKHFFCLSCLARYIDVDENFLLEKIEAFKEEGCVLFSH